VNDRPGPGRPRQSTERRAQILDAFIELLADRSLESVSLDDVARAAGVQRSMIRHFVGNRADLIKGAVEVLAERYESLVHSHVGPEPSYARLVDHLFSDRWSSSMAREDAAFGQLLREAAHDDQTRGLVKEMYDRLLAELAAAVRRDHPAVSRKAARDHAYLVVCAAEHNVAMRGLGYAASQSRAMARALLRLADTLAS
jgi:AcrR family transcriptional regulator